VRTRESRAPVGPNEHGLLASGEWCVRAAHISQQLNPTDWRLIWKKSDAQTRSTRAGGGGGGGRQQLAVELETHLCDTLKRIHCGMVFV